MGTWAVDSFGNDDACDWTYELEKVSDLTPVEEALNALLNCDEEGVEASEATEAIAAIEVIARLQGNWGKRSACLLYTSPSPRDGLLSRMPSSA